MSEKPKTQSLAEIQEALQRLKDRFPPRTIPYIEVFPDDSGVVYLNAPPITEDPDQEIDHPPGADWVELIDSIQPEEEEEDGGSR